jgi:hypothetical protein
VNLLIGVLHFHKQLIYLQIYNFFSKVRAVGCSPFAKKENHLSILGVMLIVILYIVFDVSVSHRSISSR